MDPASIDAVVLSHEHGDHARGAMRLAARFGTRVAGTCRTLRAAGFRAGVPGTLAFEAGSAFRVGGLEIATERIPHDAADPVAFRVTTPAGRVGFALDLGHAPEPVVRLLAGCETLLVESNHDPEMLRTGPYPAELKARLRGPRGHLSNAETAALLERVACRSTRTLVLAHLSRTNNRSDLALASALGALDRAGSRPRVVVADPSRRGGWIGS